MPLESVTTSGGQVKAEYSPETVEDSKRWIIKRGGQTIGSELGSEEIKNADEALAYVREKYGYGDDVTVEPYFSQEITRVVVGEAVPPAGAEAVAAAPVEPSVFRREGPVVPQEDSLRWIITLPNGQRRVEFSGKGWMNEAEVLEAVKEKYGVADAKVEKTYGATIQEVKAGG